MVMDVRDTYDVFGDNIDGHYGNQRKGDVYDDNATDILLIEATDFDDEIWISEEVALISSNAYAVTGAIYSFNQTFTLTLTPADGDAISVTFNNLSSTGSLDTLVSTINAAIGGTDLGNPNQTYNKVEVVKRGNTIAFVTRGYGRTASLTIDFDDSGDNNLSNLGFVKGQAAVEQMVVDITGYSAFEEKVVHRVLLGTWRAANGTPMVEQFRVSGLGRRRPHRVCGRRQRTGYKRLDGPQPRLGRGAGRRPR